MYDNICKYLAEQHPIDFVNWIFSSQLLEVQVLKTELNIDPISADSLTFLQTPNHILHIEFQTEPTYDPPLPLRMLDYWVRLYRKYRIPIEQVVIFLKPTTSPVAFTDEFIAPNTRHDYRVIRLWEQDPEPLLANPALLPLAPLARTDSPRELLEQVVAEVAKIQEGDRRRNISACVGVLAGLRFEKNLINQLLREETMRESVIYQDILQKGEQRGIKIGLQQGEVALVVRQLNRRLGAISSELQARIQELSIPQLEALGEALLDFSTLSDLTTWLESQEL